MALSFGFPDVDQLAESIPISVFNRWKEFYRQSPWGSDIDDLRGEVQRIRWLLSEYGDGNESIPDWQWPYASREDDIRRDPLAAAREMKRKELARREAIKKATEYGERNCSETVNPTAGESVTDDFGVEPSSSFDPSV